MADKRPIAEQVKSGFRITAWLFFSFFFAIALLMGWTLALGIGDHRSIPFRFLGVALIAVLGFVLYRSVKTWALWLGAFLMMGAFRAAPVLVTASDPYSPYKPISRVWALQFVMGLVGAAILLFYVKLSQPRKKLSSAEKAGATAIPLGAALLFATGDSKSAFFAWPIFVAVGICLVSLSPRLFHAWRGSMRFPELASTQPGNKA